MRVDLLTREYPPEVYGGAGVHVAYLARELRRYVDLRVQCFGSRRTVAAVYAHAAWDELEGDAALETMSVDLAMARATVGTDLVHSHTWYANLAGHLSKLAHECRTSRRCTASSRYAPGSRAARRRLRALVLLRAHRARGGRRRDRRLERHEGRHPGCYPAIDPGRVEVVLNGIDTDEYRPDAGTDVLERHGIDAARPSVVFVGRITRQKGLSYLLDAALRFEPGAQLILCAGAPDTAEIAAEVAGKVDRLRGVRDGVVLIEEMLPREDVVQILSHATVFACPSVYEPLGIVNLEAMACEAAVVATEVGGIPEVVQDGVTGLLVPFEPAEGEASAPADPAVFAAAFADRVNALLADPAHASALGRNGRARAVTHFGWAAVAQRVTDIYRRLV